MKDCIIFSGGTVTGNEYFPKLSKDTLIISADGGYLNALKFNLMPNICMGDFDTLQTNIHPNCEVIKFPPEKDDTDTMLCIKKSLSMGYDNIYIYGATGGRFDHTIANLQSLEYILQNNANGYLIDAQNIIAMQGKSAKKYKCIEDFKYFSIFSISENAEVSAFGLKYVLNHTKLIRSFPLGISNEFLINEITITVHNGTILTVYSKD